MKEQKKRGFDGANLEKLRKRKEELDRIINRSRGASEESLKRLKKELRCTSIEEAKKFLKKLCETLDNKQEECETLDARYLKKWQSKMEN